jgi:SAM-dependent methyltransferase
MENDLFNKMHEVEAEHWWFVARRKIIESVIKKLDLGPSPHILDVGCGIGDNLALLSKYGDVVSMERDDNALSKARARNIGRVVKGEFPDEIAKDVSQENDLIVMLDVLEHIDDDSRCLAILKNWTMDNGKLLITVPAYQFLWTKHDDQHHHKRRYTVNKLKRVLSENGWYVEYISYFNTFLFPLALIYRIKQKIFPSAEMNDLGLPNKYINSLFEFIFALERNFIGTYLFPFGLSIIAIAQKK